jgi:hypothetical protein
MDLTTLDQAEALVENGKTLRERTMAQSVELDEPRVGKQRRWIDWGCSP